MTVNLMNCVYSGQQLSNSLSLGLKLELKASKKAPLPPLKVSGCSVAHLRLWRGGSRYFLGRDPA